MRPNITLLFPLGEVIIVMHQRIKNPYVLKTELIQETGIEEIDDLLYCLVNVLQISMGDFLRSIFIIGSYVHGGYTLDSDIDYCLVWKETSQPTHWRQGYSLVEHLWRISKFEMDPMYNATERPFYDPVKFHDDSAYFEHPCGPLLKLAVKEHSLLLWGSDIRPRIALSRKEDLLKDVIAAPLNWIKQTHYNSLDAKIDYPLTALSSEKEKEGLGYGNLYHMAIFVIHLARALVFLETGEFIFNKMGVAKAYETHVGGAWSGLVRDICDARYGMMSQDEKQMKHINWCQKLTAFQNYFLERLFLKGIDV